MNKFQKIFLLCCLFSYVFSLKVTNIEPKKATLGDKVEFTLTVQDYDSDNYYSFYLSNDGDDSRNELSCSSSTTTTLKCTAEIRLLVTFGPTRAISSSFCWRCSWAACSA